jgi:hypothetical protein
MTGKDAWPQVSLLDGVSTPPIRITELPQALFFMQYADFGWVTQV